MVQINAGTFSMGQEGISYAIPVRNVTLSAFKMSKYTVTQELYFEITGRNPSEFQGVGNLPAAGEIQGKRPVEQVNWFEAVEFCNKLSEKEGFIPVYSIIGRTPLTGYPITAATVAADWTANGYRLPTEAEWEYACRAGTTTRFSFGDTDADVDDYVWYSGNSELKTHQVGKKLPNAWGLFDMHGNVDELCWDWFKSDYYSDSGNTDNPKGPETGSNRTRRGSGWNSSVDVSSRRAENFLGYTSSSLGFRLVRQ